MFMKSTLIAFRSILILSLASSVPFARADDSAEVRQLRQQLSDMKQAFENAQAEQRRQIEELTERLNQLGGETNRAPSAPSVGTEAEKKKLEAELAAELQNNQPSGKTGAPAANSSAATSPGGWSADQPITVARAGSAYMNISFDALMDVGGSTASDPSAFLELGDHDPLKRGFTLPNAEIALDGAVDPYFKGFANIVFKLDRHNETEVELEETYFQSTSLPANLQVKGGQFFANFGRQNAQHPHQWAFVDAPIILTRAFGPDGLRNLGGQVSWLAPTPFYTEAFLGVLDGEGDTAFSFRNAGEADDLGVDRFHGRRTLSRSLRGPGDLVFVPRVTSSWDVGSSQTLVAGLSGAFGPNNTGADRRTEVYGADIYWKWKPANAHAGFPFVSWQTEALYENFEAGADPGAGLGAETLHDWGLYSQLLYGFHPRWVAGLRGEYADGNRGQADDVDVYRGQRTRVSPVLTFYPTEFSKFRLQYNYDQGQLFGTEHSIWFQIEFLLGAHGAHKF